VRPCPPEEIQLVRPGPSPAWPEALSAELEEQIRKEWPSGRIYGPIHSSVGLWLRDPLVTAQIGGRVLVPVIDGSALPVEGSLELPDQERARRVVVLVDASASANALTAFAADDGSAERIPVIEAERRALEHLVALEQRWLEVGVIAFGESTWPIAEPGIASQELRGRLEQFRGEHPRGEGRTDAVCALWTARDWLADTPPGVEREIIVLTDGDLPHSGRFAECDGPGASRVPGGAQACRERRNRSACPARRALAGTDGYSDLAQLAIFSRETPLVFELDRPARVWEQLARRTGSKLVRVPSARAIEGVLPALVSNRVRGVVAHNTTTGETSPDLLQPHGSRFGGALRLAPGANDVELRVLGDRGLAGLFRFRVYSEPGYLERQLAQLRERNRALESRARELGAPRAAPTRELRIGDPAAPAD
jgi:hypothetical protein